MKESLQPKEARIYSIRLDKSLTKKSGGANRTLQSALDIKQGAEAHLYEEPLQGMEIINLLEEMPDGKTRELGYCTFKTYEKPFPFLYVSWVVRQGMSVSEAKHDKTVGDMLMEVANNTIKKKGLPGILGNTVPEYTSAHDVYARNGWKKLAFEDENPNTVWMSYELPESTTKEQMAEIVRETKLDDPYFASHGG